MDEVKINEQLAVLLYEVRETRIQATKTNGRLIELETNDKKVATDLAVYQERLWYHMQSDDKIAQNLTDVQKEHGLKLDKLSEKIDTNNLEQNEKDNSMKKIIYTAAGASGVLSALLPYLLAKL